MKISVETAREIVRQISDVVEQKINIINTDGVIIASSTPEREGSVHGAAKRIMEEGLSQLTVENDSEYEGTMNGVNLPILLQGETVGIIGITGKVDEVLKYGQIIKRMTEILLLESRTKEQQVIEQKARDRFLDEWVLGDYEVKNEKEFLRAAESLQINVHLPRRIVVFQLSQDETMDDAKQTEISRYIRHHVKNLCDGSVFRTATKVVCIIDAVYEKSIEQQTVRLIDEIEAIYGCKLHAGADWEAGSLHLHDNYRQAAKALDMAIEKNQKVVFYDMFDLEFLMGNIPAEVRQHYLNRLFGNIDQETIQDYLSFIEAFIEADGSIQRLSENLYVHVNTIKYRIRRLEELTGYDIRTPKGVYVFTLATKLA